MPFWEDDGALGRRLVFCFGEPGSGILTRTEVQEFEKLKDQCLQTKTLFEDPEFPPSAASLGSKFSDVKVTWQRPRDLVPGAKFVSREYNRFGVMQGDIGDCWLLAALDNLTFDPGMMAKVIPPDQCFQGQYAGIFHFHLWLSGRWVDVPIDDKLPTVNGQLLFVRSSYEEEFWGALLEKAVAKLFGSYTALVSGSAREGMQIFSGGVSDFYVLANTSPECTFERLVELRKQNAKLCACVLRDKAEPQGLVVNHSYSVNAIEWIRVQSFFNLFPAYVPLLRLRNPWGTHEWTGNWSDNSPLWDHVDEETRRRLQFQVQNDGEFWIDFSDFFYQFDLLEICHCQSNKFSPDVALVTSGGEPLLESELHGEWTFLETAGGCRMFGREYALNPQVTVTVKKPSTITIALLQKNSRTREGSKNMTIGIDVYQLEEEELHIKKDAEFFRNRERAFAAEPLRLHERTLHIEAERGQYLIVLHTTVPMEGQFLARCMNTSSITVSQDWKCILKNYLSSWATPEVSKASKLLEQQLIHKWVSSLNRD